MPDHWLTTTAFAEIKEKKKSKTIALLPPKGFIAYKIFRYKQLCGIEK
jgi:hypothetical protein